MVKGTPQASNSPRRKVPPIKGDPIIGRPQRRKIWGGGNPQKHSPKREF